VRLRAKIIFAFVFAFAFAVVAATTAAATTAAAAPAFALAFAFAFVCFVTLAGLVSQSDMSVRLYVRTYLVPLIPTRYQCMYVRLYAYLPVYVS